jgi:hypothetical protein
MKNLFDEARVGEVQRRLSRLQPSNPRLWGRMNSAQMMAHCSKGLEMAAGQIRPPRALMGLILGPVVKRAIFHDDKPMVRNSPTAKLLIVDGDVDFDDERNRLGRLIDRFADAGPEGCTNHPHMFFGPLTPDEWAILMYKHLDHHLRQFGA